MLLIQCVLSFISTLFLLNSIIDEANSLQSQSNKISINEQTDEFNEEPDTSDDGIDERIQTTVHDEYEAYPSDEQEESSGSRGSITQDGPITTVEQLVCRPCCPSELKAVCLQADCPPRPEDGKTCADHPICLPPCRLEIWNPIKTQSYKIDDFDYEDQVSANSRSSYSDADTIGEEANQGSSRLGSSHEKPTSVLTTSDPEIMTPSDTISDEDKKRSGRNRSNRHYSGKQDGLICPPCNGLCVSDLKECSVSCPNNPDCSISSCRCS